MKELVYLMINLEQKAAEFYLAASECFVNEPELKKFLFELSAEESHHHKIMKEASIVLEKMDTVSQFTLDNATKDLILSTFSNAKITLTDRCVTAETIFETIANIEFSEWNGLFFYIVSHLKETSPQFKMAAIQFQQHLRRIKKELEQRNRSKESINKLKSIPPLWDENILVVDDTEPVANFLEVLLSTDGRVDIARDGRSAMDLLEKKFYAAIISDISMPKMDGFAFYKEAVGKFASARDRFVFFSSEISDEEHNFIEKNRIRFIQKPGNIKLIRETVYEVISRAASLKNISRP